MTYECLFDGSTFIVAKPQGWVWSDIELALPYTRYTMYDLAISDTDYDVLVNGVTLKASQIDSILVRRVPEWPTA